LSPCCGRNWSCRADRNQIRNSVPLRLLLIPLSSPNILHRQAKHLYRSKEGGPCPVVLTRSPLSHLGAVLKESQFAFLLRIALGFSVAGLWLHRSIQKHGRNYEGAHFQNFVASMLLHSDVKLVICVYISGVPGARQLWAMC